jgi:ribonuclease HI
MTIKTDGGSRGNCLDSLAAWAYVGFDDDGNELASEGGLMAGTCSEAEYHGLLNALRYIVDNPGTYHIRCDSKLVVEQTMGRWKCKEPRMKALQGQVKTLWSVARPASIKHIPREKNQRADEICNQVMHNHAV